MATQPKLPEPHFTDGPWGVEQTSDMLWVGPMRADGYKVDQIVVGLNIESELSVEAALRQFRNARLIAAAPEMHDALLAFDSLMRVRESELGALSDEMQALVNKARAALANAVPA